MQDKAFCQGLRGFTTLMRIILTAIHGLLNLYAKKFRCPDVLTSIFTMITLKAKYYPTSQDITDHDA
ncbi:cobalt import ATP-binding protein CbiO [Shimwellia blattae DSM 4481 = NBRC 105725]|uniref:Cobalt import ATP-binding protein CbiO n=1 Tax=Shimwellia blattae (strain ATCC 29907 / DSM 4481 / JCM 1650 / NBRC 105725 / CDC 9005-74) TaxID=630626 RepID=I2BEC9_SHIBC|nr:cobalt import ATP-binding protein CbiO [Shimwellia blattae DSM 4481 = NBRC 105725]